MNSRTEEFLYFMMFTAEAFMAPTWRNLSGGSFEGWAWRNGLGPRIAELQRLKLLETVPEYLSQRLLRLTNEGHRLALGGRDPEVQWNRQWDGRWRMVLFDIPVSQPAIRRRFWKVLKRDHFGFLQNSVWISPDPIDPSALAGAAKVKDVESLIVIDGRPAAGEPDGVLVRAAWDFREINAAYLECAAYLDTSPQPRAVRDWAMEERRLWARAMYLDPLLPRCLWPAGYLGPKIWAKRNERIGRAAVELAARPA